MHQPIPERIVYLSGSITAEKLPNYHRSWKQLFEKAAHNANTPRKILYILKLVRFFSLITQHEKD